MSENNQNQEGQKTIVSFVVGLLIGGLIVWMFSGAPSEAPVPAEEPNATTTEETTNDDTDAVQENENGQNEVQSNEETTTSQTMEVGDGSVSVNNQPASNRISLDSVTYPMSDGWIGVRDHTNGNLGGLLGVVRFSESERLVPEEIILQRPTDAGREYAIVFYTPSESNHFNLANNTQVEGIFATFTAE